MSKIESMGFKYSCINLGNKKLNPQHVTDVNCCETQKLTDEQKALLKKADYNFVSDNQIDVSFANQETAKLAISIFQRDVHNLTQILGKDNAISVDRSEINNGKLIIRPLSSETNFVAKQVTGFVLKNRSIYCSSDLKGLVNSLGDKKFLEEIGMCCALDKGLISSSRPIIFVNTKSTTDSRVAKKSPTVQVK